MTSFKDFDIVLQSTPFPMSRALLGTTESKVRSVSFLEGRASIVGEQKSVLIGMTPCNENDTVMAVLTIR